MKKLYFLGVLTVLMMGNGFAQCMLKPVDLAFRLNSSSTIIEGKVISSKSFWNSANNYIYTSNLISVTQVLKGNPEGSFIEIITCGGIVGMMKQTVEPSLQLSEGEKGVFILNPFEQANQYGYAVFQANCDQQGFIRFLESGAAKEPFKMYNSANVDLKAELEERLQKSFSDFDAGTAPSKFSGGMQLASAPVTSLIPTTISAGTASQLTITGTSFGATQGTSFVQFRNADDGGATNITPHSSQYVSWSNTMIVVQVPSRTTNSGQAGTGQVTVNVSGTPNVSAQTLTVSYGHINVFFTNTVVPQQIFNTRHHNQNGAGGMNWRMFTGFDANTPAKNDFQTAFATWRCATYINWQIAATTTVNTIAQDGINVVRFDVGAELPGGVLGVCTSYFSGCVGGGAVYWHVIELDIVFDSGTSWQYGPGPVGGGNFDFESVVLHELGHGHQLGHVIDNPGVMHWSIGPGQLKNTLNANDIAGGQAVMTRNLSGAVCGNQVMVALTASTCAMSAPTASFNVISPACVGQNITLTDLSTNAPNTWTWTMTGGSPANANTQNTVTSYATAGTKTITLIVANGTGSATISKTLSVIANPTLSASSASICSGNSATLTASGSATSYVWNPGALAGTTQVLSPGATQVYTVVGSVGTCTGSATGTITVSASPTITVNSATVCTGSAATLTASGAGSYTWTPGGATGAIQTYSPASTTIYTINGVSGNCSSTKTTTITVSSTIAISAAASPTLICAGELCVLTASGATNYTINPGAINSYSAAVYPSVSTTYTVNGQTTGCSGSTNIMVSVSPCTGVEKQNTGSIFLVYPNPTDGELRLTFNGKYTGKITVYDALGREVITQDFSSTEYINLNLSEYAKGIYVLKFSSFGAADSFIKVLRQ
jgi:hypothetical protein